jgi:hypothetical protein
MTNLRPHLYPTYIVSDATGRDYVQCINLSMARDYVARRGGSIRLEPRQDESRLSPERRKEIDAIYAAGV